jgi:secreted Zn-dependent insulinase-like peptidase
VIGWRHEMEALSREDALSYYKRFYAPNNATLVIAGDVTPDKVRALAEKHYGPLEPSEGIVPRVSVRRNRRNWPNAGSRWPMSGCRSPMSSAPTWPRNATPATRRRPPR